MIKRTKAVTMYAIGILLLSAAQSTAAHRPPVYTIDRDERTITIAGAIEEPLGSIVEKMNRNFKLYLVLDGDLAVQPVTIDVAGRWDYVLKKIMYDYDLLLVEENDTFILQRKGK